MVKSPDTETATMLVREGCYGGISKKSPLKLNSGFKPVLMFFSWKGTAMIN